MPPVYLEVPDKSGVPGAGSTRVLNAGLTAAEVLIAAEPAPVLDAAKGQRRRREVLGFTWIFACLAIGALVNIFEDAVENHAGEAEWVMWVLLVLIPSTAGFTFYLRGQERRHKKRHKVWLSQFIASWPLREKLVEVERIRDLRQRVIVEDLAATMAEGREAVLLQPGIPPQEAAAGLLEALTAVGAYARAPTDDPALEMAARQAVGRFSEQAGRRRKLPTPSGTPNALPPGLSDEPDQRLRRRSDGSVNDGGR